MSVDQEDPSAKVTRKIDRQEFSASRDRNDRQLIERLAEGRTAYETGHQLPISSPRVRNRLRHLRQALLDFFGGALMADVCRAIPVVQRPSQQVGLAVPATKTPTVETTSVETPTVEAASAKAATIAPDSEGK